MKKFDFFKINIQIIYINLLQNVFYIILIYEYNNIYNSHYRPIRLVWTFRIVLKLINNQTIQYFIKIIDGCIIGIIFIKFHRL